MLAIEQLMDGCKIVIIKTKLSPTRGWAGDLELAKLSLLPAELKRRKRFKLLDVRSIEHKGTEDGSVHKVKI